MSTRQHCVDGPLETVPTTGTERAGKGAQQRHGGAHVPATRCVASSPNSPHRSRSPSEMDWGSPCPIRGSGGGWPAGSSVPPPPTSTAFLKWGERELEADVTTRQGALLHRRGFSWERRFGGLARARAGTTKDHKWERNSEGPCGVAGG